MLTTMKREFHGEVCPAKLICAIQHLMDKVYWNQPTGKGYDDKLNMDKFIQIQNLCRIDDTFCLERYFSNDPFRAMQRTMSYRNTISEALEMDVDQDKLEMCVFHLAKIKEGLFRKGIKGSHKLVVEHDFELLGFVG